MFKKALIPALVLAAASVAVPAVASAQSRHHDGPRYEQNYGNWQPIAQRKYNLDRRIDQGQRNGALSRREATRLRGELNSLVRLEANYQRGGFSLRERQDLDRRYDNLSRQIRWERNDRDNRRH